MTNRGIRANEFRPLADFRYGLRKFLRFSKELLVTEAKLTPEQYEALLALRAFADNSGLLVGELSERLQVKHHTAVSLADKLVRRKLVTKKRGARDRREVYLTLTSAGVELVSRLAARHREELRVRSGELMAALRALKK